MLLMVKKVSFSSSANASSALLAFLIYAFVNLVCFVVNHQDRIGHQEFAALPLYTSTLPNPFS